MKSPASICKNLKKKTHDYNFAINDFIFDECGRGVVCTCDQQKGWLA